MTWEVRAKDDRIIALFETRSAAAKLAKQVGGKVRQDQTEWAEVRWDLYQADLVPSPYDQHGDFGAAFSG